MPAPSVKYTTATGKTINVNAQFTSSNMNEIPWDTMFAVYCLIGIVGVVAVIRIVT